MVSPSLLVCSYAIVPCIVVEPDGPVYYLFFSWFVAFKTLPVHYLFLVLLQDSQADQLYIADGIFLLKNKIYNTWLTSSKDMSSYKTQRNTRPIHFTEKFKRTTHEMTIKPADRNLGIVLLDTQDYIQGWMRRNLSCSSGKMCVDLYVFVSFFLCIKFIARMQKGSGNSNWMLISSPPIKVL